MESEPSHASRPQTSANISLAREKSRSKAKIKGWPTTTRPVIYYSVRVKEKSETQWASEKDSTGEVESNAETQLHLSPLSVASLRTIFFLEYRNVGRSLSAFCGPRAQPPCSDHSPRGAPSLCAMQGLLTPTTPSEGKLHKLRAQSPRKTTSDLSHKFGDLCDTHTFDCWLQCWGGSPSPLRFSDSY